MAMVLEKRELGMQSEKLEINKIFGIGSNKTGTSTLGACFDKLGFAPQKRWSPGLAQQWTEDDELDIAPIIEVAHRHKCFQDFPWNYRDFYKTFDTTFPNSKFILTVREPEVWFDSYRRWSIRPGTSKIDATYKTSNLPKRMKIGIEKMLMKTYDIPDPKPVVPFKAKYLKAYNERNASIQEYFKDRPNDLLVINWEKGDGWKEVCEFLGKPIVNEPLPHATNSKAKNRIVW
jgi:hypothetical protein